jgi:hypothetical protein
LRPPSRNIKGPIMNLNQQLHDHQVAMMGGPRSEGSARSAGDRGHVALLAARIRATRAQAGADVDSAPFVVGDPLAE